jgi:HlyD family secretion protein
MKKIPSLIVLALVVLLAACTAETVAPAASSPTPVADAIVAEGHLAPYQGLFLFFPVRGRVEQILVADGDRVTKGQVLVRLGDGQQAQAAFTAARMELTIAQQGYDTLVRTADLAHAQAWQAYLDAQKIRAAAQLAWDKLDLSAIQTDIDDAQADVTSRQAELEDAQKDFNKYSDLPADNATRKSYEDKLRTAQTSYDTALQKLVEMTTRRDSLHAALDTALGAEEEALRTYQNTQDGPDADKLALAQARLDAAQDQSDAAQAVLDNYELRAPFNGMVANVNVSVGDWTGPEAYAVAVADYSAWYVDTSDLSELNVVSLSVGQTAKVTADALPDVVMTGVVESISGAPELQGGDILYTVRIRMDSVEPGRLWGMTVEVKFDLAGK